VGFRRIGQREDRVQLDTELASGNQVGDRGQREAIGFDQGELGADPTPPPLLCGRLVDGKDRDVRTAVRQDVQ
jgi:hypothetical protein